MPICKNCDKEFPNRAYIDGHKRNLNKRKYCLGCSPFGEHNTRKIHVDSINYRCYVCGETDKGRFYKSKPYTCKQCHNKHTNDKAQEKRAYALSKLGGKCQSCGFDKYPCSLDIHHKDPSTKDVNFASLRHWSYDRIDKEIEKCVLLCKNCHSAYHYGFDITY